MCLDLGFHTCACVSHLAGLGCACMCICVCAHGCPCLRGAHVCCTPVAAHAHSCVYTCAHTCFGEPHVQLVPCCECVCTCVPARACVCAHVRTLTGVCIPAPMCISARVHMQIHVCACVCKHAQARVCRCVCKHTQACAHTHTCAHHVHAHTKHTPILQPASTPTCPEPTRERARPCTPAQGHACERSIRPSEAAAAGGEPGQRGGAGGARPWPGQAAGRRRRRREVRLRQCGASKHLQTAPGTQWQIQVGNRGLRQRNRLHQTAALAKRRASRPGRPPTQ